MRNKKLINPIEFINELQDVLDEPPVSDCDVNEAAENLAQNETIAEIANEPRKTFCPIEFLEKPAQAEKPAKGLIKPIIFMEPPAQTESQVKELIHPVEFFDKTAQDEKSKKATIVPAVFMDEPKLRNSQVKELIVPAEFIIAPHKSGNSPLCKVDPAAVSLFSLDKAQPKETPSQKDKAVETKVVIEDSAYKTAQRLMKSATFACVNDALYHFDAPIFRLLTPQSYTN